jgi:hypothetical protein
MNLPKAISHFALLAAIALLATACSQMEPAKQALDGVNAAMNATSAASGKYVPDQYAAVQAKVSNLKSAFDKQDYATVVSGAPPVLADIQSLAAATAIKKDQVMQAMATQWTGLSTSVPKLVDSVKTRVDALSKKSSAPHGVDLPTAKAAIADAATSWAKAQAAYGAGNIDDAVTAANDTQSKAQAAAAAIKMTLPMAPAAGK